MKLSARDRPRSVRAASSERKDENAGGYAAEYQINQNTLCFKFHIDCLQAAGRCCCAGWERTCRGLLRRGYSYCLVRLSSCIGRSAFAASPRGSAAVSRRSRCAHVLAVRGTQGKNRRGARRRQRTARSQPGLHSPRPCPVGKVRGSFSACRRPGRQSQASCRMPFPPPAFRFEL